MLAISVSIIIGFSVLRIIDNKLSKIAINIPQPVCPSPTIIFRSDSGDKIIKPYIEKKEINTSDTREHFSSSIEKCNPSTNNKCTNDSIYKVSNLATQDDIENSIMSANGDIIRMPYSVRHTISY